MSSNNEKITTIDSFPTDGISRVVYRYGGFFRNENNDSTNPFIEVLFIEIRLSDQWLFLDKCSTFLVPFVEIDSVQVGSIWIGNTLSDRTYKFNNKLVERNFLFNLSTNKPKNIKVTDKMPNSVEYYMPLKNYYLPDPNKVNYNIVGFPFTKYSNQSYQKVNHCVMVSNDNIQVIASSVHVLHACFSNTKEIRKLLLKTSITKIISRYFENYSAEYVNDKLQYFIKFRPPYEKSFADMSIAFLANLALNDYVQKIVTKLQFSLENTEYANYQIGNNARYPIVFPPHPNILDVRVEGIWLDSNKSRFIITRFIRVAPITDHHINFYQDQPQTTVPQKDKDPIPKEKHEKKNEHINTEEPPSRVNGEYRKQSDVETGNSIGLITYIYDDLPNVPVEAESYLHEYTDKSENVETSSDDPYGNEKTNIKKSETIEKPPTRDGRFDLEHIIQALSELESDSNSPISSISSVEADGKTISGFHLLQIKKIVEKPKHPSWIDDTRGRQLLFLQLEINNRNDFCYFLDIKKNKKHEGYCAFIFFTQYELSSTQIKKICTELESAKGIKKWASKCETFIMSIIAIKHMYATPNEWKDKFTFLFKSNKKNGKS